MVATMKIEFESYSLCLLICLSTIKVDFKVDSRKNLKMDFVKADFKILIRSEIDFKLTKQTGKRKIINWGKKEIQRIN